MNPRFATREVAESDGVGDVGLNEVQLVVKPPMMRGTPLEEDEMRSLRDEINDQGWLDDLMALMRAAGNDTRMRILYLLWRQGEVRVNDLATILDLTTPAISQQLKKLRECALVQARRDAQTIYYRLDAGTEFTQRLSRLFAHAQSAL